MKRLKILLVDDTEHQRLGAKLLLGDQHDLTIVGDYHEAELLLSQSEHQWDVLLTDMMMPVPSKIGPLSSVQNRAGEMPLGPILALLALKHGVKKVAIVTNASHHKCFASAAIDSIDTYGKTMFENMINMGDTSIVVTNTGGGHWLDIDTGQIIAREEVRNRPNSFVVKVWDKVLETLCS